MWHWSKVFDKVPHKGLLHKLTEKCISRKVLNIVTEFLHQLKQKVVPNGKHSSRAVIKVGAPQGSTHGLLFFLIHVNDLSDDLASNSKLNSSLFSMVENVPKSANNVSQNKYLGVPQDVIFSRKLQNTNHPCFNFSHNTVNLTESQNLKNALKSETSWISFGF